MVRVSVWVRVSVKVRVSFSVCKSTSGLHCAPVPWSQYVRLEQVFEFTAIVTIEFKSRTSWTLKMHDCKVTDRF